MPVHSLSAGPISAKRQAPIVSTIPVLSVIMCVAAAGFARADVDPNSGIDFVRITSPNNASWPGTTPPTPGDRAVGRGSVGYEYRIGKFEVTTAQWVEFMNAALDRPASDRLPHVSAPSFWGAASTTPQNAGGRRFVVPAGRGTLPTGNISWRTAAIYCNWLCNDKASNREAFLSGAYDVSTFTFTPGGRFNDQLTRSPGARYWIPSFDEWIKAAHYDENKLNSDGTRGGWWQYSNGTDQPFTHGPPASALPAGDPRAGTANFGWQSSDFTPLNLDPFNVALGAYAVTSPYGLYDVAGATAEWTEEVFRSADGLPVDRGYDGSWWSSSRDSLLADKVGNLGGSGFPSLNTFDLGFRIAAAIPSPSVCWLGAGLFCISMKHRRRNHAK